MKTIGGATMIAIAKTIAGTATRIRFVVSPVFRGPPGGRSFFGFRDHRGLRSLGGLRARRRFGASSGCSSTGASSNISSSKKSLTPSPPAEAPLALAVGPERALERRPVEVRPELIGEDDLRVGALPEKVIGDP